MILRDRQILQIALPSIVSNITVPLLGLIDVAITGHLGGAAYVGAIAVGGMLFNIIYWMFAFLRMGTSGMTAQAFGARNMTEVVSVLMRAVAVAVCMSAVLLCLQVPVRELSLQIIEPSEEVGELARTYFNICVWGAPAALSLFVLTGWFVGMQNSRMPMIVAITQNVSNILASLVLVYVLEMKIEGVALGTVIAQYIGLGVAVLLLLKGYARLKKYKPREKVFSTDALKRFFMLNKDIFFRTICLIFVHFYFIAAGAKQGDTELAVNTLLMQMFLLYSYIMDGFAFAGEAMVGKAIGAKSYGIYIDTIKRLFLWGTAMVVVFTLAYAVAGKPFMGLLTDDAAVLMASDEYHVWTLLFPVCGMAAFIWDGVYIGATATKGMLMSMAGGMIVFFSVFYLLDAPLANHGLWIAFNAYILMRGAVQTVLFFRDKSLGKEIKSILHAKE